MVRSEIVGVWWVAVALNFLVRGLFCRLAFSPIDFRYLLYSDSVLFASKSTRENEVVEMVHSSTEFGIFGGYSGRGSWEGKLFFKWQFQLSFLWKSPGEELTHANWTPIQVRIEAEVHRLVTARDKKYTNFIEYNNYKLIYRRYAGLFFTIAVDVQDNELSYLETIHLFVELLDSYFSNVCELDIVFHFNKVYSILDEFMLAGEIEETSKREILDRVKMLEKMEKS